jgi:hypothetical protein
MFTLVLIGPAIRILSLLSTYSHTLEILARATSQAIRASALSRFLSGQTAILLQTVIYAAVWYAYLLKSERVTGLFASNAAD